MSGPPAPSPLPASTPSPPATLPAPAPASAPKPSSSASPTPVAKPAAPPAVPPPARPPRSGDLVDRGVTRRESVHALSWRVDGSVKVTGEVDVGKGTIVGQLSIGGALTADSFRVRGGLQVGGAITTAQALSTDGAFHAAGPVRVQQASLLGTSRLLGDIIAQGPLTTQGQFAAASVRASEVRAEGSVDVPGTIEAGAVDIRIRADSRLGVIRARSVRLVRAAPRPIERVFGRSPPSRVARIEAERAELEGVEVAFLRCPEVILGRDAHVTELEGTIVRRHPSATVGPRSKSPRPYGLSR